MYVRIYLVPEFPSIFFCLDTHPGRCYTPLLPVFLTRCRLYFSFCFLSSSHYWENSLTRRTVALASPCSDRQSEKCQRQTTDGADNFPNLAVCSTNCYFLHQRKTNGSFSRHSNLPINIRRMSAGSQKACGRFAFMSYSSLSSLLGLGVDPRFTSSYSHQNQVVTWARVSNELGNALL